MSNTENRYMIKIKLELENTSPFWSGKDSGVIFDEEKRVRVFGSSIYGAIKSQIDSSEDKAEELFGSFETSKENSLESKVYISDMRSEDTEIEIKERAGIRIDNKLGSTVNGGLYNSSLIPKGNKFEFRVEARELDKDEKIAFDTIFEEIIKNIQSGKICFGGNKTNGFGQFKVIKYLKKEFNLSNPNDLIAYLDWSEANDNEMEVNTPQKNKSHEITFKGKISDSLLVKNNDNESSYKEESEYIVPSRTIKGSMRSYFGKILNTLNGEVKNNFKYYDEEKRKEEKPVEYKEIIELLGHNPNPRINNGKYQMGKLLVDDVVINVKSETEYHRIKIDRFTGGVMNGALLTENRITGGEIEINIRTREPLKDEEKALLFLYFRDLGLGKITLGSNASVGSGRVEGESATIDGIKFDFVNVERELSIVTDEKDDIKKVFENLKWGEN